MAKVSVRGFTIIRDIFGASVIELEVPHPETVKGVLDALLRDYGSPLQQIICDPITGKISPFPVRLNEEVISSVRDGDVPVKSGDELTIIYPVGGGC